jgi:hypothetical protein
MSISQARAVLEELELEACRLTLAGAHGTKGRHDPAMLSRNRASLMLAQAAHRTSDGVVQRVSAPMLAVL